jgi:hypothetical protein
LKFLQQDLWGELAFDKYQISNSWGSPILSLQLFLRSLKALHSKKTHCYHEWYYK